MLNYKVLEMIREKMFGPLAALAKAALVTAGVSNFESGKGSDYAFDAILSHVNQGRSDRLFGDLCRTYATICILYISF